MCDFIYEVSGLEAQEVRKYAIIRRTKLINYGLPFAHFINVEITGQKPY